VNIEPSDVWGSKMHTQPRACLSCSWAMRLRRDESLSLRTPTTSTASE